MPSNSPTTVKSLNWPAVLFALAQIVAAMVIAWNTKHLSINTLYGVGPGAAPLVISGCLFLLGLGNLTKALFEGPEAQDGFRAAPILLILVGIGGFVTLLHIGAGFILAACLPFALTARAFGRKEIVMDIAIGLIFSTATYVAFAKFLTLSLPAGPLERLI